MAPMHKTPSEEEIAKTLGNLKLSTKVPQKPAHKPKSKPVADSWDEDSESDTETESEARNLSNTSSLEPVSAVQSLETPPNPPPPTPRPQHPLTSDNTPYSANGTRSRGDSGAGRNLDRRPEKTTAVAGRLIAGALGVRAPKRTEEERQYDRAMKEKEKKKRTEEKEREKREAEEAEARKKAIWDD